MEKLLLIFSITCFGVAAIGYLFKLIDYLFDKPNENKEVINDLPVNQPTTRPSINIVSGPISIISNFISNVQQSISNNYKLNTSKIQFCREVVQWTGPILRANGVKYYPSISVKYNSSPKYFGVYTYSTNSITIYLKSHKGDLSEICSTVLHEVMHHISSKKDREFKKLLNYKKYGYYNNRIEVEARAFEKQYCQMCMIDLCKKGIISKC